MAEGHLSETANNPGRDDRPGLAVVVNALTPYRIHLHKRIAEGIPQFKLHTLLTHAKTEFTWQMDCPASIGAVSFSTGTERSGDGPLKRPLHDWRMAGRIMAYLKANRVRAVIMMGYNNLTRLRLIRMCGLAGIAVFLRGDSNIRADRPRGRLRDAVKRRLVGWVIRHCNLIMPVGSMGQAYYEKYGAKPEQCVWVPFEPDYAQFSTADPAAIQAVRDRFALPSDRRYILFSGRLVQAKRADLLLDAFAAIAGERADWDLLIAGDGPLRQALEQRVPQTLRGRVHWLGFMEVGQLIPTYHLANVLVLPSEFEPWALVINEALAAGLVVVASDVVGAAHDLVADGVNGRIFPSGNLDALTEALADATSQDRLPSYHQAVGKVLDQWRQQHDPVEGVRIAMRKVGLAC